MTFREKLIELISTNTIASDKEFYDIFVSRDGSFSKQLHAYTSSREAITDILDSRYYKDLEDFMSQIK